ncbi:MAG: hypothetical protein ACJASX_001600 [Limisphaerales bacterium]|jgi:hypothetical protein
MPGSGDRGHWNDDSKLYAKDGIFLRDQLVKWMAEKG